MMTNEAPKPNRSWLWYIVLPLVFVTAMATMELWLGRNLYCPCGIKFMHGDITNYGNSQHLFDWYSLTHTLHGLFFYWVIGLFDRKKKLSIAHKFAMAVFLEAGWEVLENTKWIIAAYRSGYDSFHYTGDSVVNSVGDVISTIAGFLVAAKARFRWSVPLFILNFIFLIISLHTMLISNSTLILDRLQHMKLW